MRPRIVIGVVVWRTKRATPRERRAADRKPVEWVGRYSVTGSPNEPWFPCAVLNVSRSGAGLVLFGGLAVEVDETVVMDIERIGSTPVMLRLRGRARFVGEPTPEGGLAIGVRLSFDDPHAQKTAQFLFSK
jgi:hypothetical protein